jgi:hypothetical protein
MTGHQGFTDAELPVFGAVNLNWRAGSSMQSSHPLDPTAIDRKDNAYGINSYGDVHFHMKDSVRDRLVYTATDHGVPRRDPWLAFTDFFAESTDLGMMKLKSPASTKSAFHAINSLITKEKVAVDTMPFEVQIFGKVDFSRHAKAMHIAPSLGNIVQNNARQFAQHHGIPFQVMSPKDVRSNAWAVAPPDNDGFRKELIQTLDKKKK